MILIVLLALFLNTPASPILLSYPSQASQKLHSLCLMSVPKSSSQRQTLGALLCGSSLSDEKMRHYLSKTSLIHIFVVSGAHLLLLDQLLGILRIPVFVRFIFLLAYTLAVGWQPPAVRALLGLSLRRLSRAWGFFVPADILVLLTGFSLLGFFPSWWHSLSFQMSWCAGLALSTTSLLPRQQPFLRALFCQVSVFLFMIPCLWGFASLHPLGILFNLILAPIIAYALLPLAVLSLLHPIFLKIFEALMIYFEKILQTLASPISLMDTPPLLTSTIWIWIFSLQLLLHCARLYLRRRLCR